MLAAVCSLQFGAALAATLFGALGPLGTVAARLVGAAAALGIAAGVARAVARGKASAAGRGGSASAAGGARDGGRASGLGRWRTPVTFGLLTAAMNTCVYLALDRLPLGAVITIEFLGPLGLSLALSRRWRDAGWAACALAGVVLLGGGLGDPDAVGILLALVAAACWAGYIVLNRRLGDADGGGLSGLALSAVVAAIAVGPIGVATGFEPTAFALGCVVGVLSSALPYALDLLALRRLPPRVFGVLMSLGPAVAALAGWLVLGQALTLPQVLAIGLVVLAGVGVTAEPRPGRAASGMPASTGRPAPRPVSSGGRPAGVGAATGAAGASGVGEVVEQGDVRRLVRIRLRLGEERRHALDRDVRRQPFEAQRDDVGVVPESRPTGRPRVRHGGGPRPGNLVRGDRGSGAGPAHEDAVVRVPGDDRLGDPA
ncbi:hypothetical protein GCM10020369_18820 [Cryptosporangium minutisporangium]|uniref:EamA domain-containing protein n=1 Tax=Cryptosporangium minutisporangium TaxID=113569 RepID=A0ABP6SV76_9ACTN